MGCFAEERLAFSVGPDRCEGMLAYPETGRPKGGMLLLGPHPHFGGTMENNVLLHVARAAAGDGLMTLRFNYRGIGESTLELPQGLSVFKHYAQIEASRHYQELIPDCIAAWDALTESVTQVPIVVFGYSLGTLLAAKLAVLRPPAGIVGLSPPTGRTGLEDFATCSVPVAFIAGDRDFAFDRERFEIESARISAAVSFTELAGCDHFFRLEEARAYQAMVGSAVYRACAW